MATDYKLRVLVVDDSEDMRLLLRIVLNGLGCTICGEAANGVEAIGQATQCNPELIVLDMLMPVMDGLACLPILHTTCPDAVIVMFSAQIDRETRMAALENGATAFVNKARMDVELFPIIRTVSEHTSAARRTANRRVPHDKAPVRR